jgi:hypothetical protein
VRRRLELRQGNASDADWSVYLLAAANWEEIGSSTGQVLRAVSMEGSPEQALTRALEALRQLGLHE